MKNALIDNYEKAVIDLLWQKAFYAKLIISMKKDFSFPLPTAAVGIKSTGITLHLNEDFFNSLTHDERVAILEHEAMHILHAHALRFKQFGTTDHGLANIACDVAINQYITNLPKVVTVKQSDGSVKEGKPVAYEDLLKVMPDLLPKMNAEYYFNKLKQEQQKSEDFMLTDDHDEWKDTDLTPEQEEKFIRNHVKAILETCSDKEKSIVDKTIIDELYKSNVDWKAQLRSFFANSEETYTETTRKKRNRRYGILQAGHKNESKLNLAICVDTSGSISDEQLKSFFGEVSRIYNESTMVLHIIEADCVVRNFYTYKKNMKIEAQGRSGTAYQPAIDKAKELKADSILYMGDFDTSDVPVNPRVPFLWVGCSDQNPPADFGRVIRIK